MTALPKMIIDLHTHLFNARCLPLAGIIANALGKDAQDCLIARLAARLLNALTETNYTNVTIFSAGAGSSDYFIEQLSQLTVQQLYANANLVPMSLESEYATSNAEKSVESSEIYICLKDIEEYLVEDGSWTETDKIQGFLNKSTWARKIVRELFERINKGIVLLDDIKNYAEFFFNILTSEADMAERLIADYGNDLPPITFVHHMMDIEMAYQVKDKDNSAVNPAYEFFDNQLLRMQAIHNKYKSKFIGFSAFDPRRDNWIDIVKKSKSLSYFRGFKFYPSMGYKPYNNENQKINDNVLNFFRYCVKENIPVFTHCTPLGFQTKEKLGLNANPELWGDLLSQREFNELRLCFGHGGGGYAERDDGKTKYFGWTAKDNNEWNDENNFARKISTLCKEYPNVYCELAYITELFEGLPSFQKTARENLKRNLLRSRNEHPGNYDFFDKIAYGSDWHMPSMLGHPRAYLNIFLELFDSQELSEFRDKFFAENAYKYLAKTI